MGARKISINSLAEAWFRLRKPVLRDLERHQADTATNDPNHNGHDGFGDVQVEHHQEHLGERRRRPWQGPLPRQRNQDEKEKENQRACSKVFQRSETCRTKFDLREHLWHEQLGDQGTRGD